VKRDLLWWGVRGGVVLLFFLPVLFSQNIWGFRDFHRYIYPVRLFGKECLESGVIPFWNLYVGFGTPFLANIQTCVFYPLSLLIYLFPFNIGIKLYVVFHFFLAALSVYLLSRNLSLDRIPAFVAGTVYAFSGWMVSAVDIIIILTSSAWIGFILLFLLKSKESFVYTVFAGVSLFFQFLSGEPFIFYSTLIIIVLFSLCVKISMRRTFLAIVIAISFSLFQLLPFSEFVSLSQRVSLSYKTATRWALEPYELFDFALPSATGSMVRGPSPYWFGQFWLKSFYLGTIPFLLGISTIFLPRKEKVASFFSILFLVSLLLSLGDATPLYKPLYEHLPLFSLTRYPSKWLYPATISLSILSGFGTGYLLKRERPFLWLFLGTTSLFSLLYILILSQRESLPFLLFLLFGKKGAKLFTDIWLDSLFLFPLLIVCVISLKTLKRPLFSTVLSGLILMDLFWFGKDLNPLVKESIYCKKSRVVEIMEKEEGFFRTMLSPNTNRYFYIIRGKTFEGAIEECFRFCIPNLNMLFGIFSADSYDSLYVGDFMEFIEKVHYMPLSSVHNLLSMMNVKYVISREELCHSEMELVYTDRDLKLYRNRGALSRAFLVEDFKVIENKDEILEYITSKDFCPDREVVLEEEPEKSSGSRINAESRCEIAEYLPNKVVIKVFCSTDGFLFLSDTYYPGWRCYVDGKPTKIYRANYCFRAVRVDRGEHIVEFRYLPKSFIVGVMGSIASAIMVAIALLHIKTFTNKSDEIKIEV
jgi:hypothetical protein